MLPISSFVAKIRSIEFVKTVAKSHPDQAEAKTSTNEDQVEVIRIGNPDARRADHIMTEKTRSTSSDCRPCPPIAPDRAESRLITTAAAHTKAPSACASIHCPTTRAI